MYTYVPVGLPYRQSALLYRRSSKIDGNQLDHLQVGTVQGVGGSTEISAARKKKTTAAFFPRRPLTFHYRVNAARGPAWTNIAEHRVWVRVCTRARVSIKLNWNNMHSDAAPSDSRTRSKCRSSAALDAPPHPALRNSRNHVFVLICL